MKFNKEFFKSMLEYDKILHFVCGLLVSIAVAGMFFKMGHRFRHRHYSRF